MTIVCVFSHPDDEAFGPGGTIASLAKEHEVHLICATHGEAGSCPNPKDKPKLGQIRMNELEESAKILGVKTVTCFNYKDGELCNNNYHEIGSSIMTELDKLKPEILLTFEPRGVTGHLDHIAISMVTTYLFEKSSSAKELWYYCLSKAQRDCFDDYFIYFPPGYSESAIDKSFDVTSVWEQKIAAMQAHTSQKQDCEMILSKTKALPKIEHFIILAK